MKKQFFSICFAILIVGFLLGIVSGIYLGGFLKTKNQKLDECFDILEKDVIHDVGENEINSIVNQTSYLGKNPKRLTLIADLITNNFTDPNWNYQQNTNFFCYYPDENVSFNYCLLGQNNLKSLTGQILSNYSYMYDKKGRIRQFNKESGGNLLSANPYWIAYQKTGECQELSILFNKTANESGFDTRIIRSDGNGHYWNEVNIDGEWKFFDVQQYGGMKSSANSSNWFGNTSDYANTIPWQLCDMINKGSHPGIFVYDFGNNGYGENRNQAYDPNHLC